MNEKEKKAFYIATCKCCLLAEAMKSCAACQFNIGLAEQDDALLLEPYTLPIPIALFSFPEQQQLEKV